MPLYEYQCDACAHRFEVIQKFSDAPIAVCPKCGGPVQKLLSSPAIQFKGSGFYLTDYGRGTGKNESGGGKGEKKTDGAKTDGAKTDAGGSEGAKSDSAAKTDGGSSSSSESKASSSDTTSAKPTASKSD